MLEVIDSHKKSAFDHMKIDEELLQMGVDTPSLRFYEWSSDAVTYGYFINPSDWLKKVPENSARRSTGGGLIFHESDFSFTVALPLSHPLAQKPTLERYCILNTAVLNALQGVINVTNLSLLPGAVEPAIKVPLEATIAELCMANPTVYDVMLDGKKVGGSAQRKNKRAFIHQCSLFLALPNWDRIYTELLDPDAVLPKLKMFTSSLFTHKSQIPPNFREEFKSELKFSLKNALQFIK